MCDDDDEEEDRMMEAEAGVTRSKRRTTSSVALVVGIVRMVGEHHDLDDDDDDDDEDIAVYGEGGGGGGGGGDIRCVDIGISRGYGLSGADDDGTESADRDIIDTCVDPSAWRAETERLGPILRLATREVCGGGGGDGGYTWPHHIEQLRALANQVSEVTPALREDVTGLVSVLRLDMDAVDHREDFLRRNIRLDLHEAAYRDARASLDEATSRRRSVEERVSTLTHELADLSERCMSTAIDVEDAAAARSGAPGVALVVAAAVLWRLS